MVERRTAQHGNQFIGGHQRGQDVRQIPGQQFLIGIRKVCAADERVRVIRFQACLFQSEKRVIEHIFGVRSMERVAQQQALVMRYRQVEPCCGAMEQDRFLLCRTGPQQSG